MTCWQNGWPDPSRSDCRTNKRLACVGTTGWCCVCAPMLYVIAVIKLTNRDCNIGTMGYYFENSLCNLKLHAWYALHSHSHIFVITNYYCVSHWVNVFNHSFAISEHWMYYPIWFFSLHCTVDTEKINFSRISEVSDSISSMWYTPSASTKDYILLVVWIWWW